jgi:hypothetical protein
LNSALARGYSVNLPRRESRSIVFYTTVSLESRYLLAALSTRQAFRSGVVTGRSIHH